MEKSKIAGLTCIAMKNGIEQTYHANGKIATEVVYRDGLLSGVELAPNIRPLIRENKLWSWAGLRFDCYGYARWKGRLG